MKKTNEYEIINKSVTRYNVLGRGGIRRMHNTVQRHSIAINFQYTMASRVVVVISIIVIISLFDGVLSHLLIIDAYAHVLWNLFNFNRFAVYMTQNLKP